MISPFWSKYGKTGSGKEATMSQSLSPTPLEESWQAGCVGRRKKTIREGRSGISYVKEEEPKSTINCGKQTLGRRRNVVKMIVFPAWATREATVGNQG